MEGFSPDQKEQAFKPVLMGHLAAKGYVVAKPEPDLGDDVWFTESCGFDVHRGQIKSAHTCEIDKNGRRKYCFRLQHSNLGRWSEPPVQTHVAYVYFLAMADNRFQGIAEGRTEGAGERFLDVEQATRQPPVIELPVDEDGCRRYRTEAIGYHVACMPASFFAPRFRKWSARKKLKTNPNSKNEGSIWVFLDERKEGSVIRFQYTLFAKNITKYCGQIQAGLSEALEIRRRVG